MKVVIDNNITLSLKISAKDRHVVYIEISKQESVVEKNVTLKLDRPEYFLPIKHLLGTNLDEAGSEKVKAIFNGQRTRDIYDLYYYLIKNKNIKLSYKLINKKFEYYNYKM
ncbi:MAG: nucleotidyl transferase AbiEii/AbiGii toxin family protein [Candidatus Thermoplasmatota archaeon]|nr:nucleotidyl transferase AbiEii/AbiGii toxin family protein [Candidatus Thermoplasmatota archaeon]MCL5963414.1 nucleotidyl transferase AbiEii/AbiGii toxin family protein [Candidatus Thermoplasmatota archaeon]